MTSRRSAGILLFRRRNESIEIFLVHPGGPYWKNKDDGAWSFPKGEYTDEDPLDAARREFLEETGFEIAGVFHALQPVRQSGGKLVSIWSVEGDCDATQVSSNTFSMEWPPRSGKQAEFPEVDRAAWFSPEIARKKLLPGQLPILEEFLRTTPP